MFGFRGARSQSPEARWVIGLMADALGVTVESDHRPAFVDLVYGDDNRERSSDGAVLIPTASAQLGGTVSGLSVSGTTIQLDADVIAAVTATLIGAAADDVPEVSGRRWVSSVHDLVDTVGHALETATHAAGLPFVRLAAWPNGAPYAGMLSHDIDQIYDRELFRVLADLNHLRRMWADGESGDPKATARRMLRSCVRPKRPVLDFATMLALEREHSFRPTFFVLDDRYWARYGARYRLRDPALRKIVDMVLEHDGEIGVHGSYYGHCDTDVYERQVDHFVSVFGVRPAGVRCHHLRFSYPTTWRAQQAAGFEYDSTFGSNHLVGPRGGFGLPYKPFDQERRRPFSLTELPLLLMDTTLFRWLNLDAEAAKELVGDVLADTRNRHSLVALLWHNNFFNEPEYAAWQEVYTTTLARLAADGAWVATGKDIADWRSARQRVAMSATRGEHGQLVCSLHTEAPVEGLVAEVSPAGVAVSAGDAAVEHHKDGVRIRFGKLRAGDELELNIVMPEDV